MVIQHRTVIPESIHTRSIPQTEQALLGNMYVCTYKEAVSFKESKEGNKEGLGGRKRKWEMTRLYYNVKK